MIFFTAKMYNSSKGMYYCIKGKTFFHLHGDYIEIEFTMRSSSDEKCMDMQTFTMETTKSN